MTRTWIEESSQTELSTSKRVLLVILGLSLAGPALIGLLRIAGATFLFNDMDFSDALPLLLLLGLPYSAGLLAFFLGLERLDRRGAVKKTVIVLAITVAAIVAMKLIGLVGAALASAVAGDSSDDSSSDNNDSDDSPSGARHSWLSGGTSASGTVHSSEGTAQPAGPTCGGCGRYTSIDGLGFCARCSAYAGPRTMMG